MACTKPFRLLDCMSCVWLVGWLARSDFSISSSFKNNKIMTKNAILDLPDHLTIVSHTTCHVICIALRYWLCHDVECLWNLGFDCNARLIYLSRTRFWVKPRHAVCNVKNPDKTKTVILRRLWKGDLCVWVCETLIRKEYFNAKLIWLFKNLKMLFIY